MMDLGVLEETIKLSTTAHDAVLYLCNSITFANLILQILFPLRSFPNEAEGVYDLSVLADPQETASLLPAPVETLGLVLIDNGPDSLSSNRVSSSNSTIRFENSAQPVSLCVAESLKKPLLFSAGCGCWEEATQVGRRAEIKYLTVLDIVAKITSALDLCVTRCTKEENAAAANLLMDWVVQTGVWKFTPEPVARGSAPKLPIICHGLTETQVLVTKMLASHARRTGVSALAHALSEWAVAQSEPRPPKGGSDTPGDGVFVVDPNRMAMVSLAQIFLGLSWLPPNVRIFQLTDRHLIKPLLTLTAGHSAIAARLFASFNQLPKICAKFHQDANADGLEECFKLLCPPLEYSLETLPTSIMSAANCAASQWWESPDTLRTLSHVVRGSEMPLAGLLCTLVAEDETHLFDALQDIMLLYAVVVISDVSLDRRRRSFLTPEQSPDLTSRDWCLAVFNQLAQKWLEEDSLNRARLLVLRVAATLGELKLLCEVLRPETAEDCGSNDNLTPRVIWRALLQAAHNEHNTTPPSLARYVSPELLAERSTSIAPAIAAFNFWWTGSFKDAAAQWSLLAGSRVLLAEHGARLAQGQVQVEAGETMCPVRSPFTRETYRRIDECLLRPTLIEQPDCSCREYLFATLFFLICPEERQLLAEQIVSASSCLTPRVLMCLWTGDSWGDLLREALVHHSVNSEESVHIMSVCTLLSALPPYAGMELFRAWVETGVTARDQLAAASGANENELPPSRIRLVISITSGTGDVEKAATSTSECRTLRGAAFLQHSLGGLLSDFTEAGKLLSLHTAREGMKAITSRPEMGSCRLKLDAALNAVYESGKKHLNVLGLALSESVRLLLNDQSSTLKELESQCQRSLLRCVESADKTRQQSHDVCLSSTLCDICGQLLTHHHALGEDVHALEIEALQGKVCAMNACDHRYHAMCLRSLSLALAPNKSEALGGYSNLLKLFESFRASDQDETLRAELVKNMQSLISKACPLCTYDLTVAI